jgi:hypothetical protein
MLPWRTLLLIALAVSCGPEGHQGKKHFTDQEKQIIRYAKPLAHILAKPLPVPDSLGGRSLVGGISLDVRVTQDGRLHGFRVNRIEISPDTLHWFVYSSHRPRQPWSDSLLTEFLPWIERYCQEMRAVDTRKDSLYLLSDTLWLPADIRFGDPIPDSVAKRLGKPIYRGGSQGM